MMPDFKTQKTPWLFLCLGLLALGCVFIFFPKQHFILSEARLFPADIHFYIEGKLPESELVYVADLLSRQQGLDASDQTKLKVLRHVFKHDLFPQGALGCKATHCSAAIAIRHPLEWPAFLQTLGFSPQDYHQIGQTYFIHHPQLVLYSTGEHLLIAQSESDLKKMLAQDPKHALIRNTAVLNTAPNLPTQRDGTLLMQLPKALSFNIPHPPSVGSIQVNSRHLYLIKLWTEGRRSGDSTEQLVSGGPLKLPTFLSEGTPFWLETVHLEAFVTNYLQHHASASDRAQLKAFNAALNLFSLDIYRDLPPFFKQHAGLAFTKMDKNTSRFDGLAFATSSTQTQRVSDQLAVIAAQLAKGTLADKDVSEKYTMKVLQSSKLPLQVAYGNLDAETFIAGNEPQVAQFMQQAPQKKTMLLSERYQRLSANHPKEPHLALGVLFSPLKSHFFSVFNSRLDPDTRNSLPSVAKLQCVYQLLDSALLTRQITTSKNQAIQWQDTLSVQLQ
jgi:hypothetical protein